MNEVKALKLSWDKVANLLQQEIERILNRKISCRARADDENFWCVGFANERIPLSELYRILESVNASKEERIDSLPDENDYVVDVNCLGMSVSELLLRRSLGYQWETIHIEDDALWVLGEKDGDYDEA